jgi:purine-cytosine permease-like protein
VFPRSADCQSAKQQVANLRYQAVYAKPCHGFGHPMKAVTQQPEPINEYEREPVPERAQLGLRSYVGQFTGEHVAGTELMIGPLFLAAGVSAFDFIFGLLVGNLLAVLSWTFLTAPIAARARLTMYYQLEKICGRKLVTAYNLANGVMFTVLAGAMMTVSATALGVFFKFSMPQLTDTLPTSVGWVVAVLITGGLFSAVAACGYKFVARFANIAAPWMVLVFLAFGIIGLREMGQQRLQDFWSVASTAVWKGGAPLAGRVKFTFWHVMFFAWFCNMAWHIGMADLSILRFAKKSWYGLTSAAGMYIGHFMAWIAASILYAVQLKNDPGNIAVLPGPFAYNACGLAGLLCVIAAGWTTANPTLYRAGLAFQSLRPASSRFKVTLLVGLAASVTAVFPIVTMRLLDFVALWGMILMPMGAVIFVDFWILPRLGLRGNFAEATGRGLNWAAGAAWLVSMAVGTLLVQLGGVQIYFVSLPCWFVTVLLYIGLSALMQRRAPASSTPIPTNS